MFSLQIYSLDMEKGIFLETCSSQTAYMCQNDVGADPCDENTSVILTSECELDNTNTLIGEYQCRMETCSCAVTIYFAHSTYLFTYSFDRNLMKYFPI